MILSAACAGSATWDTNVSAVELTLSQGVFVPGSRVVCDFNFKKVQSRLQNLLENLGNLRTTACLGIYGLDCPSAGSKELFDDSVRRSLAMESAFAGRSIPEECF